jgi:hypothetical protein
MRKSLEPMLWSMLFCILGFLGLMIFMIWSVLV